MKKVSQAASALALAMIVGWIGTPGRTAHAGTGPGPRREAMPASPARPPQATAMVRLISAMQGSEPIDVLFNDKPLFTSATYQTISPYVETPDVQDKFRISVRQAGADRVLVEEEKKLDMASRYTVVAMPGDKGGVTIRILKDLDHPRDEKIRLRVVNASPGAGTVDLAAEGNSDPLFGGVRFGEDEGYREVQPADVKLELRGHGDRAQPLRLGSLNLQRGAAYTVVIAGMYPHQVEMFTVRDGAPVTEATGSRSQ